MIPSDAAIDAVVAQTGMGRMQAIRNLQSREWLIRNDAAIRRASIAFADAVLAPALDNLTADHARFRAQLDAAIGGRRR